MGVKLSKPLILNQLIIKNLEHATKEKFAINKITVWFVRIPKSQDCAYNLT